MGASLTEDQIDDLLDRIGVSKQGRWKGGEKMVCCPVHGESRPSMGVSSEKQVCHCFSCGFGGGFAKLLLFSMPEEFGYDQNSPWTFRRAYAKACGFLEARYGLERREPGPRASSIRRYGEAAPAPEVDASEVDAPVPMWRLAPFMSGKETYQYFYDRGFDSSDVREHMVGRDLDRRTVTLPAFRWDGSLAGVVGRYIDPREKNERYRVYFGFRRGSVLYPEDKYSSPSGMAILVEGQLDALRMRRAGFASALALTSNEASDAQCEWLLGHCSEVVWVGDSDGRGREGRERSYQKLKGLIPFKVVDYPDHGKDPCDWTDAEVRRVVASARAPASRGILRL